MYETKIKVKQRINLIHWHSISCPDGNSKLTNPWKKILAQETCLSQATISNLCKAPASKDRKSFRNKTLANLDAPNDEAFLKILGFVSEAAPRNITSSTANQTLLTAANAASNQDDYVDLCIEYGISINSDLQKVAQERAEKKREQAQKLQVRWRSDDDAYWFQPYDVGSIENDVQIPMHHCEVQAIEELFELMTAKTRSLQHATLVVSRPYSGVTYALRRLLPEVSGFGKVYHGGTHHIHIGALLYPDDARSRLAKQLLTETAEQDGRHRNSPIETQIAMQLHSTNQLLIIHGVSAVPDRARHFIRKLCDEVERISKEYSYKKVSRVIFTAWSWADLDFVGYYKFNNFTYEARIHTYDALGYFRSTLDHYRAVRGAVMDKGAHTGPKAENAIKKRAEFHYNGKSTSFTEFPSAIRYRAFCASDTTNPSPFDPTQGIWDRVDPAWRHSIPEISDCVTDIQSDLRNYHSRQIGDDLQALRTVSTGIFFLSSNMIARLAKHPISKSATREIRITEHLLNKYIDDITEQGETFFKRYTAPLLVRSIIQDDWVAHDHQFNRFKVHEALGDILREMATSDDNAPEADYAHEEIPYEYPWGDGAVVLGLEAIRHFSRAASSAPSSARASIIRKALDAYDELLEDGTFSDPDGEKSRKVAGYLSRSHGLQAMKYEALCLLSSDGRGRETPIGMSEKERYVYFREFGITRARMLHPGDALTAFECCLELVTISNFDRSYVLAHAISASILRGDLKRAIKYYEQARDLEEKELNINKRDNIRHRNNAREAMIAFASGKRCKACTIWEDIAEEGLTPFYGDRATSYFDAHLATPIKLKKNRAASDKLRSVIEHASHMALDKGFTHEFLSIEIRKATFARIVGYPSTAEAVLEHVGLDLAKHGGSELLFSEFQLESAETLCALNRPRYAFVAYAWPAFQLLKRRDVIPLIRKARNLCAKLLRNMDGVDNEPYPSHESHKFYAEIEKYNDGVHYPLFSLSLLPSTDDLDKYFLALAIPETRSEYLALIGDAGV